MSQYFASNILFFKNQVFCTYFVDACGIQSWPYMYKSQVFTNDLLFSNKILWGKYCYFDASKGQIQSREIVEQSMHHLTCN